MRFEYGWQRVRPLAASLFLFAVACGGPSVQNPGPGSPASVRAEGAPAPDIATSITRDPLAEDPMPSGEEHEHAHHGRSSSPPAPDSPQPHQHGSGDSQGGPSEDHPLAEDPMPRDEEHDHAHHGRSSSPPAPGSPQPHQHGSRDSQGGSTEDHSNHGAGR